MTDGYLFFMSHYTVSLPLLVDKLVISRYMMFKNSCIKCVTLANPLVIQLLYVIIHSFS
jgi:hypothetical protein